MAGYSGTPLAKKLGIKPGDSIALLAAPDGFERLLDGLPNGVQLRTTARGTNAVIVSFHTQRADLERRVATLLGILEVNGGLWIAWPKKGGKVPTGVTEDTVREAFPPPGLLVKKVRPIGLS